MSPHRLLEPTGFLPPFPLKTFNLSPARKPLLPRKQNSAWSFLSAPPNSHQHREEGRTSPSHELSYNRFPLANKQKTFAPSHTAPSHQLLRPYTLNSSQSTTDPHSCSPCKPQCSLSLWLHSQCGDRGRRCVGCGWWMWLT